MKEDRNGSAKPSDTAFWLKKQAELNKCKEQHVEHLNELINLTRKQAALLEKLQSSLSEEEPNQSPAQRFTNK